MLGYCGMLDLCAFKVGVEWEVAFSQQLYSCCHFFVQYLATGSREDGAQALKLQFAGTNPLSWGV